MQRKLPDFSSLPIRIKLLVIIIGICAGALLLSAGLEVLLNWNNERKTLVNDLQVTAEMISLQSRAALEFLDPKAAGENLSALAANATIRRACLYNETGSIFASYNGVRDGTLPPPCPAVRPAGNLMRWGRLEVFHDIVHNDNKIGSLYLERDLTDLYQHFINQVLYKLIIILSVIALVWMLSFYFQRMISEPIIQLAENTWLFSHDRHRQINAVKVGDDELGKLVDAFNAMMEEIRRNELQLEQAIAELTRSNTELERFAHICSHDLQEPLRMVSSYTALLEKRIKDKLDPDTLLYLEFITDGAERMRELIKDILAYARVGHQVEPMQPVNLTELVDLVLQNMSTTIEERKAIIHRGVLPEIIGNKTLLLQIFQNLISNAIKFCTSGPEIWISAERRENGWEFSVRDNGIGIDPKYHDKIFEIFKRLNRREEFQGTGIGLAIFKKAVQYHGGHAWIESQPGKGTTFFFIIPSQEINPMDTKEK